MPSTRLALRFGHGDYVRALAHSPDRRLLATGDDLGHVLIHDRVTGGRRALCQPDVPPIRSWRPGERIHQRDGGLEDLVFVGNDILVVEGASFGLAAYDVATGARLRGWDGFEGPLAGDETQLWCWADAAVLARIDVRSGAVLCTVTLVPPPDPYASDGPRLRVYPRHARVVQVCDGVLRVWDAESGALWVEHRFAPSAGYSYSSGEAAALSPDGTRVATVVPEGLVIVDLAKREHTIVPTGAPPTHNPLVWLDQGVFWGRDGQGCWDGERVLPFNAGTGRFVDVGHRSVWGMAPEGPLAMGGTAWVRVMDDAWLPGEQEPLLRTLRLPPAYDGFPTPVPAVQSVAVREGLVVAGYADGRVRSWSLDTGALVATMLPPWGAAVALADDGSAIVSVGHEVVWIHDVPTGRLRWRLDLREAAGPGAEREVLARGHRLAGRYFAALVGTFRGWHVGVWDLSTGARVTWHLNERTNPALALASDGTVAFTERTRWSGCLLTPGGETRALPLPERAYVTHLAFSPDASRLVAGLEGWQVLEWHLDEAGPPRAWPAHRDGLRAAATDTGILAAAPGYDARLWHFNPALGRCRALPGHRGPTRAVAFSSDGRWLASGAMDGAVCVRDAFTGRLVVTFQVLPGGDRWLSHLPSGLWRGEGAEDSVGDGYGEPPGPDAAAVVRALRRRAGQAVKGR